MHIRHLAALVAVLILCMSPAQAETTAPAADATINSLTI